MCLEVSAEHSQFPKMISASFKKGPDPFIHHLTNLILLPQVVTSLNILRKSLNMKRLLSYTNSLSLNQTTATGVTSVHHVEQINDLQTAHADSEGRLMSSSLSANAEGTSARLQSSRRKRILRLCPARDRRFRFIFIYCY